MVEKEEKLETKKPHHLINEKILLARTEKYVADTKKRNNIYKNKSSVDKFDVKRIVFGNFWAAFAFLSFWGDFLVMDVIMLRFLKQM